MPRTAFVTAMQLRADMARARRRLDNHVWQTAAGIPAQCARLAKGRSFAWLWLGLAGIAGLVISAKLARAAKTQAGCSPPTGSAVDGSCSAESADQARDPLLPWLFGLCWDGLKAVLRSPRKESA